MYTIKDLCGVYRCGTWKMRKTLIDLGIIEKGRKPGKHPSIKTELLIPLFEQEGYPRELMKRVIPLPRGKQMDLFE